VGDIDLKLISAAEIEINSQKPGFGRKNQLRRWKHLKAYRSFQA
jgi:hypothetical protein